jgi:hypothetical protein
MISRCSMRSKFPTTNRPKTDGRSPQANKVSDADHLKVFATVDAAETWFEENGIESTAVELMRSAANPIGFASIWSRRIARLL